MLVLSRERGLSIVVNGPQGDCTITVLEVRRDAVSLLLNIMPERGRLDTRTVTMKVDEEMKLGTVATLCIADIREEKVRLGITASKESAVHRLEVYDAIKREKRDLDRVRPPDPDDDEGTAGVPARRPTGPKPPPRDVRLKEPPADEST